MALLETRGLTAFYGDFQALYGIDLRLEEGETLAIIGANGAGKSTFLKTITGLLTATPESVMFGGRPIGGLAAPEIVRLGISLVPEGRRLFPSLSVEENLAIGAYGRRDGGYWSLAGSTSCSPPWPHAVTPHRTRCRAASSKWRRSGAR